MSESIVGPVVCSTPIPKGFLMFIELKAQAKRAC